MKAKNVILFITGFRETPEEFTGLENVWQTARGFSSPSTWVVKPYRWDCQWGQEAAQILRGMADGGQVVVCAYSWGAGYGFLQLAKHLGRGGARISLACLCDPVYRHRFFWGLPLSLTGWPSIKIPYNVDLVKSVYQRVDRPRGHKLIARGETVVEVPVELNLPHKQIDNSRTYKAMCLDSISETLYK
tara:strand:- start:8020 stop:8583 length:564 start_codon:yes stop_codon:yes gene_type:complete